LFNHLTALINTIANLAGNKQNLQTANQHLASLVHTQALAATKHAADAAAAHYDKMQEDLVRASLARIREAQRADWPGWTGGLAP